MALDGDLVWCSANLPIKHNLDTRWQSVVIPTQLPSSRLFQPDTRWQFGVIRYCHISLCRPPLEHKNCIVKVVSGYWCLIVLTNQSKEKEIDKWTASHWLQWSHEIGTLPQALPHIGSGQTREIDNLAWSQAPYMPYKISLTHVW